MARAVRVDNPGGGGEPRPGRRLAGRAVMGGPGLAEGREHPGPGRPVVVGRLSRGVLVPGIGAAVGTVGIPEPAALVQDLQGGPGGPVGEAADGPGHQEAEARVQHSPADGRVRHRAQGEGEELVGPKGVVRRGLPGGLAGPGMEAVGQISLRLHVEMPGDGVPDPIRKVFPGCRGFPCDPCQERQGVPPEGLDFHGISLPGGPGRVVGVHPGEVGGAEDQAGFRVHPDAVGGAAHDRAPHGHEDLPDRAPVHRRVQKAVSAPCRGQLPAGREKPEGGVGGVPVPGVVPADHVGEGAVLFEPGKLEQDIAGLPELPRGDQAPGGNEGVPPPIQEPGIPRDDGAELAPTDDIALHRLPKPGGQVPDPDFRDVTRRLLRE